MVMNGHERDSGFLNSLQATLKEEIATSFLELSLSDYKENPILEPENSKNLRNIEVIIRSSDHLSKYKRNTFSKFTFSFLKSFELDIFNTTFSEVLLHINSLMIFIIYFQKCLLNLLLNRYERLFFEKN